MVFNSGLASPWTWMLGLMLLVPMSAGSSGPAITYCSSDLTADQSSGQYNTWQSNLACQNQCQGSYAFAVLQGSYCWCSNYAPADQVSTYSCNQVCPGWQQDWCGSTSAGLYGYYQLGGVSPSGTAGGSSSATSAKSSPVSSTPSSSTGFSPTTSLVSSSSSSTGGFSSLTVSAVEQSSVRTSSSKVGTTISTTPAMTSDTTSSSPSSTKSASPTEIYTSVTTVTGQVKTILVTPTPTSDSTLGSGSSINSSGGGISTGKVVGIVIGVALGLGLLVGLLVWLYVRRRHQRNLEAAAYETTSSQGNTGIPSRQVSQMSSAGLLSKVPRIQTTGFSASSNSRSANTMGENFDRRSLGTDQRLNPYAIYAHDESRHSNVSLQDNQDYSRQLRVANPDP